MTVHPDSFPPMDPLLHPTSFDEVHDAANILVFAMMDCSSSQGSDCMDGFNIALENPHPIADTPTDTTASPSCSSVLKQKSVNTLKSHPAPAIGPKAARPLHKKLRASPHCKNGKRLVFKSMDQFEDWAFRKIQQTHPKAVVEKKRSAKTTTISCRNRRSDAAGGTSCTCILKASEFPAGDEPNAGTVWKLVRESMTHNAVCLQRMNGKHRKKLEKILPASEEPAEKKQTASSIVEVQAKPRKVPKAVHVRYIELDSDEETPMELRKRKANHPGNALPSRARRYRW